MREPTHLSRMLSARGHAEGGAAVNHHDLAGDVPSVFAGQEQRHIRDVGRGGLPTQRDGRGHRHADVVVGLREQGGIGCLRRDDVDPDPLSVGIHRIGYVRKVLLPRILRTREPAPHLSASTYLTSESIYP